MEQQKAKRRSKGGQKGSGFERAVCKQLSLWWSDNQRDDIFWRTAGSGARAKIRGKKQTFGQHGDVQATDPIGQPLIDQFNIEMKRGYNTALISDFLEIRHKNNTSKPMLQRFIEQAITDCKLRNDNSEWILLLQRDYKEVILFTPVRIWKMLTSTPQKFPTIRMRIYIDQEKRWDTIIAVRFRDFLDNVKPKQIIELSKDYVQYQRQGNENNSCGEAL